MVKQELGGCWETEPKDDVNLELYYEASNAIPIRLDENNIVQFTSPKSKTSIPATISIQNKVVNLYTLLNQNIFL